jgi:hypothetical protein
MIVSLVSCGYFTTLFEVFESKDNNGKRWKKAIENALPSDEEEELRAAIYGEKKFSDKYDYVYNPMIDDYAPQPKYIDEHIPLTGEELEANVAFDKFVEMRKAARKSAIIEAPPNAPGFGGKEDLYPESIPNWLQKAYKKNVLARNKWSSQPQKFDRTVEEVIVVEGPYGFRDKKPEWLTRTFGDGIWEDKLGVSRAAARAFGSYRKSMWKIDKLVELKVSDV